MDEEMLKKLRELLGAGEDLTDENALSRIQERLNTDKDAREKLEKEVLSLKSEVATLKKAKSASQIADKDPDLVEQRAETIEEKLSLLVEKGRITPDVKTKLSAILVGSDGNRKVFSLCMRDGNEKSIASQVCSALESNDIVKLGEQTGVQILSRTTPKDKDTEDDGPAPEGANAMAIGAGIEPEKKD